MSYGMESSFSGVGHLRDEMNQALRLKSDRSEVDNLKELISALRSCLSIDIEMLRYRIEILEQNRVVDKENNK